MPFVQLWPTEAGLNVKRGLKRPPWPVVFILLSILSAIFAMAGTALPDRSARKSIVTILVDRGVTMSVGDRATGALADVRKSLEEHGQPVRIVAVPAGPSDAMSPTAMDTTPLLPGVIRAELNDQPGQAIVIVTDQDLPAWVVADSRVVAVGPIAAPPGRATIVTLAVEPFTDGKTWQAMVRVRNDSLPVGPSKLTVTSASESVSQSFDLPAIGQTRDLFVNLPAIGEIVTATIGEGSQLGERAYLASRTAWPRVEVTDGAAAGVATEIVAAYTTARPVSERSTRIVVTADAFISHRPAVIVGTGQVTRLAGELVVAADSLTADVGWRALVAAGATTNGSPPTGFVPLVTVGDHVVLAATADQDKRAVWVGISPSEADRQLPWVMLWTRLFDQLGGGSFDYAVTRPVQLGDGWSTVSGELPTGTEVGYWPGVYRHEDGRLLAVNAPSEPQPRAVPPTEGWIDQISAVRSTRDAKSLASPLLLGALVCVATALVSLLKKRK